MHLPHTFLVLSKAASLSSPMAVIPKALKPMTRLMFLIEDECVSADRSQARHEQGCQSIASDPQDTQGAGTLNTLPVSACIPLPLSIYTVSILYNPILHSHQYDQLLLPKS